MINDQEYITTELKKTLEKMIILSTPRLNNLIAIIIGIIASQSSCFIKNISRIEGFLFYRN